MRSDGPIGQGITPGSGPSHLALFRVRPAETLDRPRRARSTGRWPLHDLARRGRAGELRHARQGIITDRRAGRPATEKTRALCALLAKEISRIGDVEIVVEPGKEHRFTVLFAETTWTAAWRTPTRNMKAVRPFRPGRSPLKRSAPLKS